MVIDVKREGRVGLVVVVVVVDLYLGKSDQVRVDYRILNMEHNKRKFQSSRREVSYNENEQIDIDGESENHQILILRRPPDLILKTVTNGMLRSPHSFRYHGPPKQVPAQ